MALLIGQTLVKDAASISELTRQAVAFIDGGSEWLRWSIHAPQVRGTFSDESQMAGAIQLGLHGTPYTFLSSLKLMVSPLKLMTFSLEDLRLTAEVELDPSNPRKRDRVMRIFETHHLLVNDQLAAGIAWLNAFKLSNSSLFQVMNFTEQAAMTDLANWVKDQYPDGTLPQEAAQFAATECRAPLEFVDFFHTYLGVAEKLTQKITPITLLPAQRLEAAQSAVQILSPIAFHALDCPQTNPLSRPDDVALAIEMWAAGGRPIGFARVSACVREIVLHTRFVGGEGWINDRPAWARNRLNAYLETSLELTRRAKLSHPRMGQDGATCMYTLAAGDYAARLELDPAGVITLSSLREIAAIEPTINPFAPVTPHTRKKHHDQKEAPPS